MDLRVADREIARGAGDDSVRVGAPIGRIEGVMDQAAFNQDTLRSPDIDEIPARAPDLHDSAT